MLVFFGYSGKWLPSKSLIVLRIFHGVVVVFSILIITFVNPIQKENKTQKVLSVIDARIKNIEKNMEEFQLEAKQTFSNVPSERNKTSGSEEKEIKGTAKQP